ncbi:PLP-dependent cysteine synthase family protein [Clostridium sp.]|uniref:PLP-dependent cysteine synthase family protein n=1 Tax=Clostridium sp. TaxID=1506 RepID=UPI002FCC2945
MNIINDKFKSLEKLIGNTPLIEISFKYKEELMRIFTKLEYYNFSGSIKDRVALYILKKAYMDGNIKKGDTIVEATSGNTGISFASIGKFLNHNVSIYIPDFMSSERINLLKSFGANVNLVSRANGSFIGCISKASDYCNTHKNVFLPSQFSNNDNTLSHYNLTAPEILNTLTKNCIIPDAFIAGVGTGGTIMGVSKYLKENVPGITAYPLEPANSPTLSSGYTGSHHRIQGISDEFVPQILDLSSLDSIISVDDSDAIIMAQKLSKDLGLGVGISSGANFIGALKILLKLGPNSNVITIFADDNKKYLSTDLMKIEQVKPNLLSSDVELISIKVL